MMKRKCSMCGECKEEATDFRFMAHLNRYNCYCKRCESIYNREYKRARREMK